LIFVIKYRRKVFTQAALDDLRTIFASVCADFESELIEMQGEDDHVHLLVNFPPKASIAKLVNSLKGVSSRRLRQLHLGLRRRYRKGILWSPATSLRLVVEPPSALFGNTSNSKGCRIRNHTGADAPCAYLRRQRRSLRRLNCGVKI